MSNGGNGYTNGISGGGVPKAVHSLLGSTKRLQAVLREWGDGTATVTDVSDVYVQIVNEFNAIIQAFANCLIDLSDLHSIPQEMRVTLEVCLAEEPSPEALEQYMPELKATLIRLLRGLKERQDEWRTSVISDTSEFGISSSTNNDSPRNSR